MTKLIARNREAGLKEILCGRGKWIGIGGYGDDHSSAHDREIRPSYSGGILKHVLHTDC